MPRPEFDEEQWVHERDYGSFGLFQAAFGLVQIIYGLILLVVYVFRRK